MSRLVKSPYPKVPKNSSQFNAFVPYVLTFSIMALAAVLFWGRFAFRRQNAGRRDLGVCAEAVGGFVESRPLHFDMHVPRRQVPVYDAQTMSLGVEYHFQSKVGCLTIVPHRELPSAVELRIGGKVWASYISAEFAANAVGSGLTNHKELDALSAAERPGKLGDWEQSRPHYFRT